MLEAPLSVVMGGHEGCVQCAALAMLVAVAMDACRTGWRACA